ncbi:protein RRP5 homolog [Ceratina calcarata]|uniref:Protein RRP5 homolog n=1 Tax=Ceratina calcarata TaxID=156304 RepID=A0AAJ7JA28_9HYME|nr:protein RRP5 homolog [Ceratina calcarata]
MTLKSFPRGGKKVPEKKFHAEKHDKRQREKAGGKKRNEEEEANFISTTAERLTYATISEGLTVLGCVFDVTEYDLMISLPGGTIGRAQVTDISETYTNLLQNLIESGEQQTGEFKSLTELYSVGDYVVCYVKAIRPEEKFQIVLSLEPKLINQSIDISHLDVGSRMVCTVSSIEDHGCVIDTGLTNARGFIPNKENEKNLFPGKQLLCCVKEMKTSENTSIITLSSKQGLVKAVHETDIKSLDSLMPGTRFDLRIKKVLANGVHVSFGEDSIGYVNQLYLEEPLYTYGKGMNITGTLLYILPTIKFAYFSCMLDKPRDDSIKPGDMIEEAVTLFKESGGVVLQLNKNKTRGFLPLKRANVDYEKIMEKFIPGSTHKCRILAYVWMDRTYVCTMQHSLLEEKYFKIADFQPGDTVKAKIVSINQENGIVNVQIGKFGGQVSPENVSDEGLTALKKLKVGAEVQARVLFVNTAWKKVYLTLKKSMINSNLPILSDVREAKIGSRYHGTVIQTHKSGLLIKFYGNAKGWVPRREEDSSNYSIGQTVLVKIESIDKESGKMLLSIGSKRKKEEEEEVKKEEKKEFEIGDEVEGTIVESSTLGVQLKISKNYGQNVSVGFLPAGHMSPCMETAALLASKCIPGETLTAVVFTTEPLIFTKTLFPQGKHRFFEKLKVGNCIPCSIRDVEPNGVRVILPVAGCAPFGYVNYSNVSNFHLLNTNQILYAKIMSINEKEKQLGLTLSLKKVFDALPDPKSRLMAAVDPLKLYLSKLKELASNSFYENRPISSVKLGQRVTGKIEKVTDSGLVVQLPNNLLGIISKDHYRGQKKVGDNISGTIMWKNYVHELVDITALPALMNKISVNQNKPIQFDKGKELRGRILMVTNWFVLILIKGAGKGTLVAMPVRRHMNDVQPDLRPYNVDAKIKCYIVLNSKESDVMPICMVKSAFEKKNQKNKDADNVVASKKRKNATQETEVPTKKIKTEDKEKMGVKKKRSKKKSDSADSTCIKNNNFQIEEEDVKPTETELRKSEEEKPRVPECGFFWDDTPDLNLLGKKESSSESEDETEQQPKQKKKKLNAAERREEARQKEREIREREEALASNQLPNSVDQFDRLVLGSPNSSIIWLQYMAYHLQTTEIEKARAVARRAVKTINFREENERLNVWNAWLNLESKFGTPESLNDVFQEAVRTNDSLKIYTHMLTVHIEAGRLSELAKTVNTMIGKFKQNPQVWIDCGEALLKVNLKDKSRHIMQRALQSLPPSEHVNLMARFALLENRFQDKERAQTLFEQILSSYPKRVDVWCCYVDCLVKTNDIDLARKVLERAVVQTLPPRKMKTLFKKFIAFEEQYGTQEDVSRVQQMAVEYVEKQCNRDC